MDNQQRDRQILALRHEGCTLAQIGEATGLTRERVRQILARLGGPSTDELRAAREAERREQVRSDREAVARDLAQNPNSSMAEVAARTGLSARRVEEALTPALRSLIRRWQTYAASSRWSREEVLGTLRAAAEIHGVADGDAPLTGPMYDQVRDDLDGPSIPQIFKMFGSWSSAVAAAGLVARESGRQTGSRYSDEELLDFVVDYLNDPGAGSRTFAGFDTWRGSNAPHAPSAALLRSRLGRWSDIRSRAWAHAVAAGRVTATDLLATKRAEPSDLDDDQLWAADEVLRSVEASGESPADPATYDRHLFPEAPTSKELIATFGTWGLALGALGFDPTSLKRTVRRQSDGETLAHLRLFAEQFEDEHGRPPNATEWQRLRDHERTLGPWAYIRRFGSWEAALDEASEVDTPAIEAAEQRWDVSSDR